MDTSSCLLLSFVFQVIVKGVSGATFTFINNCDYTVWPGILSNAGSAKLDSTGFELAKGNSREFQAPTGWSGRFWGRTGCNFDGSGGTCATGDCASGQVECNGAGAIPPATLAEFTLGTGTQDFYDVSLVDGYNLPMVVTGSGGSGACPVTGCIVDLNLHCPKELRVGDGEACRSACEAFNKPEYCCSEEFATPNTCKPSVYSEMFKSACPRSYSYAYDDATSTFTCTGASYEITFCPSMGNGQKSSKDSPRTAAGGSGGGTQGTGVGSGGGTQGTGVGSGGGTQGTGVGSEGTPGTGVGSEGTQGTGVGSEGTGVVLENQSLLANLATTGDATRLSFGHRTALISAISIITTLFL